MQEKSTCIYHAYPESILSTSMGKIYNQFKRFVVVRLQRQQYMVDQQVSIDLPHSERQSQAGCIL